MASKKRTRAPLIQRPSKWWREPLPKSELRGLSDEERDFKIAEARYLAVEKIKTDLRNLRHFSTAFDADSGYTLKDADLIRLHPSRLRKLRRAAKALDFATSRPHIVASPKNDAQRKSTIQRTGKVLPGQKRFILHSDVPEAQSVRYAKGGQLEVVSKLKEGTLLQRQYLFPRRPRVWADVIRMTRDIQRKGMREGNYRILNSFYGEIGDIVERDQMLEQLDEFFSTYSKWLAGTILGWSWVGATYNSAIKRVEKTLTTQERFKRVRAYRKHKERRRVLERMGTKKPCRICKKKKCVCKPPEFK